MKKVLSNIDNEKSGLVKADVFFQLLPLHQINLDEYTKNKLAKDFGT